MPKLDLMRSARVFLRSPSIARPSLPPGERVYAIGDIHGEAALLGRLLQQIRDDGAARGAANTTLVLLGDLIDRGADAADLLRTFARMSNERVVILKGNHEEALVRAYGGDEETLRAWVPFGAMATLTGLGLTPDEVRSGPLKLLVALRKRVAPDLIAWLDRLPTSWESGDYFFAHAGIRPGVKLERQQAQDLLWIREPFLSSRKHHGKVIVHGHTVMAGRPALGGNRIGLDTGAHEHGVLTALGLEDDRQWLIQVTADE